MDDKTLDALKTALSATPDNLELRMIVVAAHVERDEESTAYGLIQDIEPEDMTSDQRALGARTCLAADAPEDALAWVGDEAPSDNEDAELLIARARTYLALERHADGLDCYRAAVAKSPALEDLGLRDRLNLKVRDFHKPDHKPTQDRPRLRVLSNDDTDDIETTRLLMPPEETVTFSDVGGLKGIKKQIHRRIILPFQKPSLMQRFKKRVGGGILLYGPPGCGKTLLARATAGECDARFLNVAISDILDMYTGESERKLHAIFEKARSSAPAVLFFDEVEALGGKRQYTRESHSSKLVSQFLSEMDGFAQNNSGVLILGATNVPWSIDPAFRRPGRFDRLLFVPPPDAEARKTILELHLADRPVAPKIDYKYLVKNTSGFSGADLFNLVETATDEAIEDSIDSGEESPLSDAHLRQSLREVKPTTLEWLTTARNYARYANEAGQYDEVLDFLEKHSKQR